MILDTSAVIAVFKREPGHDVLEDKLAFGGGIGAPTLVEAGIVLGATTDGDPEELLRVFLERTGVRAIPFREEHWIEAVRAYRRYGRGRHPAKLNFGDCMSYAMAKVEREPLLFVGEDFGQTDVEPA